MVKETLTAEEIEELLKRDKMTKVAEKVTAEAKKEEKPKTRRKKVTE